MMAGLSKGNLDRLKQRTEQGSHHAQRQINTYAGEGLIPAPDASPDAWATYCNDARGKAAAAIVEWGRRISLAHDAYRVQPQRWGRTWEDWCRDNLGIGRSYANQLRVIGENLGTTGTQILPAAKEQLHALARLRQQHPDAFETAVAAGSITPQLTREQAQDLLKAAKAGPAAVPVSPPPFRRVAGVTLEADQAKKLEAIAATRGTTPAQLLAEAAVAWLKRQPMPEGVTTIDVTSM